CRAFPTPGTWKGSTGRCSCWPATPTRTARFPSSSSWPDACLDPRWRSCPAPTISDRKSTRLNSSHVSISYAVFCLKKKRTHTKLSPYRVAATPLVLPQLPAGPYEHAFRSSSPRQRSFHPSLEHLATGTDPCHTRLT